MRLVAEMAGVPGSRLAGCQKWPALMGGINLPQQHQVLPPWTLEWAPKRPGGSHLLLFVQFSVPCWHLPRHLARVDQARLVQCPQWAERLADCSRLGVAGVGLQPWQCLPDTYRSRLYSCSEWPQPPGHRQTYPAIAAAPGILGRDECLSLGTGRLAARWRLLASSAT